MKVIRWEIAIKRATSNELVRKISKEKLFPTQ